MSSSRRILVVAILASFVSFLDGSVVTVALPAISQDLTDGPLVGLPLQQWVVDAYLITVGALILLAGSLSDLYGRKKVMVAGLWGFALTSIACAVAPTGVVLVAARAAQGIAGALLVPSSLAMIIAAFDGAKQAAAIGRWTAWTSVAALIGPLVGGAFVDAAGWRWVFAINVVPVAVTLWMLRSVPGQSVDGAVGARRLDLPGASLAALSLVAGVYALIEAPRLGAGDPLVWGAGLVGAATLAAFLTRERRTHDPMLPLRLFAERNFAWGNLATAAIYGALYLGGFLVTLFLQQIGGYSATFAGLAQLPVTILMLAFSARFGALAGRTGARIWMTLGPLVASVGYLALLFAGPEATYLSTVLPGLLLFGLGLSMTVAPLTAAVLGAVPPADAGIGSAVNNAVARVAGLVAIAFAGLVIGPGFEMAGFRRGLVVTAALLAMGGVVSWVGIRDRGMQVSTGASGE